MTEMIRETGKQVGSFMEIMKQQPLSLALVVMNFLLVGYLFYAGSQALEQRKETSDAIIRWQQDTDKLMAGCVSADVMKLVLDAVQKVIDTENRMRQLLLEHGKDRAGQPLPGSPNPAPQSAPPSPLDHLIVK